MKGRRFVSAAALMPGIKKAVFGGTAAFVPSVLTALPSFACETNNYLSSFQNINRQSKPISEIHHNFNWQNGTTGTCSLCVDPAAGVPVPVAYCTGWFSVAGNRELLKTACLMDNCAYSKAGVLPGFDALQNGTIVRRAVYSGKEKHTTC